MANALSRARDKGYDVDERMWKRMKAYLRRIEQEIPSRYSKESRDAIRAYALSVRRRMGDTDAERALKLLREAGLSGLSLEAMGWLLPVLHEAGHGEEVRRLLRHIENHVTETAAGAHFVTGRKSTHPRSCRGRAAA